MKEYRIGLFETWKVGVSEDEEGRGSTCGTLDHSFPFANVLIHFATIS